MTTIKQKEHCKYGELSRALIRDLRKAISAGEYPIGSKLPSNRELAKQKEVSQVTARMAVLQLVREGLLEVRKNCGTYVRSIPSGSIPEKAGKPSRIGVILSPWDSENTPAWDSKGSLSEILKYVSRNECQIMIFSYSQWRKYAEKTPEDLITRNNLDTLVWFYTGPHEVRFILELERLHFRQLILNRRTFGLQTAAILLDEEAMAEDIPEILTKEERSSLLVISASTDIQPYADRVGALRRQLEKNSPLQSDFLLILPEARPEGNFPEWTRLVLKNELERLRPKAVVDFVGYINYLSSFPDSFFAGIGNPRFISTAPPTAWECRKDFHYTCYDPEQQAVNKAIRQFFEKGAPDRTIHLPYIRKEI